MDLVLQDFLCFSSWGLEDSDQLCFCVLFPCAHPTRALPRAACMDTQLFHAGTLARWGVLDATLKLHQWELLEGSDVLIL